MRRPDVTAALTRHPRPHCSPPTRPESALTGRAAVAPCITLTCDPIGSDPILRGSNVAMPQPGRAIYYVGADGALIRRFVAQATRRRRRLIDDADAKELVIVLLRVGGAFFACAQGMRRRLTLRGYSLRATAMLLREELVKVRRRTHERAGAARTQLHHERVSSRQIAS